MEITIRAAQLNAQDVRFGEVLTLQEVRLTGTDIRVESTPGGPIHVGELTATLILTEATLNRLLAGANVEGISDLEVATLQGRVRISGRRKMAGFVPVPFALLAGLEIESGTRLRLNLQEVELVGAVPLPGFSVTYIGNRINEKLTQAFDVSHLPLPVRLTGVIVEPGRLLLSATAALEMRPRETQIIPAEP